MKKKSILVGLLFATGALAITTTTACNNNNTPGDVETTYTVTFDAQNGSTATTATTNASGKVTKPADPTKEGYTFDGWYDNAACTGTAIDFTAKTFAANTTVYAKWTQAVAAYTVTFNSVEGSEVAAAQTVNGVVAKPANNPSKEGKVFAGWYVDAEYSAKYDFATVLTADKTLYAKWVDVTTYEDFHAELNEGDYAVVEGYIAARQTYYKGATIYIYAGEGKGFFGYSVPMTQEEYNTVYTVGTYVKLAGNIQIYAGEKEIAGSTTTLEVVTGKPEYTPVAVDLTAKLANLEAYKDAYFKGTWTIKSCESLASDKKVVAASNVYYTESGAQYMVLTDGTNDITVGINKYFENKAEMISVLDTLAVGEAVTVTGYMYWWNGPNPHLSSIESSGFIAFFHNEDSEGNLVAKKVAKDEDGFYMVTQPTTASTEYATFDGWYADEAYTTPFDFNEPIEGTVHIYAKWTAKMEMVTYKFEANKYANQTVDEDITAGSFIIGAGTEIRDESSKKLNGVDYGTGVKLQGTGTFTFVAGGAGTAKIYVIDRGSLTAVTLTKPDGTTETLTYTLAATESKQMGIISFTMASAGNYVISVKGGTPDIAYAEMSVEVAKAPKTGITVSGANNAFLKGREFTTGNINVVLNFKNGREDILDDTQYTIDSSQVDMTKAGTYDVFVIYGDFTTSYKIDVYEIDTVELYDYTITPSKYTTNSLDKVFIKDATFNHTYLTVHVLAKTPNKNTVVDFILTDTEYTLSEVSTAEVGKKTVTVTCADSKTASYDIYVVENVFAATATAVTVNVDPSKEVSATAEGVNFKTITDALTYLKACKLADNCVKTINIAAGTYKEKLEITLPNVRLQGMGTDYNAVVIEFGALNGLTDPSGKSTYSTVGSATVHISATAVGFAADKITFKNTYNTHELYLASKELTGNTQADALYCEADMSTFTYCKFTSYHDTLEAEKGRQVYDHCFIEGRTDFIFGNNATVLFNECEIKVIGNSTSADKNGGYIFCNKGAAGQEFVYVVNKCKIYGDENVQPGTVSLGRTWATDMKLVVMNCELSNIISKETYGQDSGEASEIGNKNDRYTQMSTSATIKPANMVEYNNTGDGAITATDTDLIAAMAEKTCTVVTDASGTKLINASSATYEADYRAAVMALFGPKNGTTDNGVAWGGLFAKDATITIYGVDGTALGTVTGYVGSIVTLDELKNAITIPDGYKLDTFYTTAECTAEYAFGYLDATNAVYAKFLELGAVESLTAYDGTKKEGFGWTLVEGTLFNGTTKMSATAGAAAGSGTDCNKIDPGKNTAILSPKFNLAKSVELKTIAASTATSSAISAKIELLDANGTVVKSVNQQITTGKVTVITEFTIESDVDFVQIRLSAAADKNFAIYNITGTVNLSYAKREIKSTMPVVKESVKTDKVYDETFTVSKGTHSQFNTKEGTGLSIFYGNTIKFTVNTNGATFALGLSGATTTRCVILTKGDTVIKKYLVTENGVGVEGTSYGLTASKGWLVFDNLEAGEWTVTCNEDGDNANTLGKAEIKISYLVLLDKTSTRA